MLNASKMMMITKEQFSQRLLEITLLLVGLYLFNSMLMALSPFFGLGLYLGLFAKYSNWVGQLGFGLIIFYRLKANKSALPIWLLSVCIPMVGGLFYLLVISIKPISK
ncbi:MAG: hypothetical protein JSS79_19115 [Bacteroidetes bacterium]|nr:hypothetical protein [Bacteroidota bacterium]